MELAGIWAVILALGMPVWRSVLGWAEKAMSPDSEGGETVTRFEWMQLLSTVLRVGTYSVLVFLGADGWGINLDMFSATASGYLFDVITRAIKK